MANLFWSMMKEEWRLHSTMFGGLSFALFPVMVAGMAFMGTFLLPLIRTTLPPGNLSIILHSNYLLLGCMAGAFGLLGNEAMNRRFGQASLIAYSVRCLPVSDRYIFTIFVAKDLCYYFFLWVFPFAAGFFIASTIIGIPLILPILLTLTLTLSFLIGLSLVFFLSTVYTRSKGALILIISLLLLAVGAYSVLTGNNPASLFPPVILFSEFSWSLFATTMAALIIISGFAILIFNPESAASSKRYDDKIIPLSKIFSRFPHPALTAKDVIDLYRSGSAIGQTLFSFLIPLVVIWFFLTLTSQYIPHRNILFLFAITTGIIASTMYTWLTAFDSFTTYASLPVSVRMVIMSKLSSFAVLQVVPVVFLTIVTLLSGEGAYLIPAVILAISISFFAVSVTIWLAGLSPHILVYDIRVMGRYFLIIGVVTAIFSSIAFSNPWASLTAVLLGIPAWILIQKGCTRWEQQEQPVF